MQLPFGVCADGWSGISPLQFGDVAFFPGDEEMRRTRTCESLSAFGYWDNHIKVNTGPAAVGKGLDELSNVPVPAANGVVVSLGTPAIGQARSGTLGEQQLYNVHPPFRSSKVQRTSLVVVNLICVDASGKILVHNADLTPGSGTQHAGRIIDLELSNAAHLFEVFGSFAVPALAGLAKRGGAFQVCDVGRHLVLLDKELADIGLAKLGSQMKAGPACATKPSLPSEVSTMVGGGSWRGNTTF